MLLTISSNEIGVNTGIASTATESSDHIPLAVAFPISPTKNIRRQNSKAAVSFHHQKCSSVHFQFSHTLCWNRWSNQRKLVCVHARVWGFFSPTLLACFSFQRTSKPQILSRGTAAQAPGWVFQVSSLLCPILIPCLLPCVWTWLVPFKRLMTQLPRIVGLRH